MSAEQKTRPNSLKEFTPGQDIPSWMLSVNGDLSNLKKRVLHLEMQNRDLKQLIKKVLGSRNDQRECEDQTISLPSNSNSVKMSSMDSAHHRKSLDSSSELLFLESEGSGVEKQESSDIPPGSRVSRSEDSKAKSPEKDRPQNKTKKLSSCIRSIGHYKRQENHNLNVPRLSRRRTYPINSSAFSPDRYCLEPGKHPRQDSIWNMRNCFNGIENFQEVLSNQSEERWLKKTNRRSGTNPRKVSFTNIKFEPFSSSIASSIKRSKFPLVGNNMKHIRPMCEPLPTWDKLDLEVRRKGIARRRVKSLMVPTMADKKRQKGDKKPSRRSSAIRTSSLDTEKDIEAEKRKGLRQLLRMTLT